MTSRAAHSPQLNRHTPTTRWPYPACCTGNASQGKGDMRALPEALATVQGSLVHRMKRPAC